MLRMTVGACTVFSTLEYTTCSSATDIYIGKGERYEGIYISSFIIVFSGVLVLNPLTGKKGNKLGGIIVDYRFSFYYRHDAFGESLLL